MSVFFVEISAKFGVSGVSETKEGSEMSTEEISINFGKKRNIGDFLKKICLQLENFEEISFCFGLFHRFFEKISALHLLLIRRLPASPR